MGFASLLQRRRSTEANQTLHDVWPSTGLVDYIYIFRGLLPRYGILPSARLTLRPRLAVLRSPILAALLHGTRVVGVSQTVALSRGRHLYSPGRPSGRALAHILLLYFFRLLYSPHLSFSLVLILRKTKKVRAKVVSVKERSSFSLTYTIPN